jgi:hypothetical protein
LYGFSQKSIGTFTKCFTRLIQIVSDITLPLCPCCKSVCLGFARLPFAGTPAYDHGVVSASAWRFFPIPLLCPNSPDMLFLLQCTRHRNALHSHNHIALLYLTKKD